MVLWFTMLAIVLGCCAIYSLVMMAINRVFPDEKDSNVKNAAAIDSLVAAYKTSNLDTIVSISKRYEMIAENPLDYSTYERNEITDQYKELLLGRIKDPTAIHAPNERKGIHLNSDYVRYMKNQTRVLGPDSWHKTELARIQQIEKEEEIGIEYRAKLVDMGAHITLVHAMTSVERMETYDVSDWKNLIRATNNYIKNQIKICDIISYLEEVHDKNTLLDQSKMELFCTLMDKEVPLKVAGIFVNGAMEDDDLEDVLELMEDNSTVEEALSIVLANKKQLLEAEIARKQMAERLL